jgi:hypothetical protein
MVKKVIKKNGNRWGLAAALVLALSGCLGPLNEAGDGMGSIEFGVSNALTLVGPAEAAGLSYELVLSGPGGTITRTFEPGAGLSCSVRVVPGVWEVAIRARDGTTLRGMGFTTAQVKAGQSTRAQADMNTTTAIASWGELKSAIEHAATEDGEYFLITANLEADDVITVTKRITIVADGDKIINRGDSFTTDLFSVGSGELNLRHGFPGGSLTLDGRDTDVSGVTGALVNVSGGDLVMAGNVTLRNNGNNDIYLAAGKTITVSGPLTQAVAATVTPASYIYKTAILTPGFPEGSPGKFTVNGNGYYLTAAGKLAGENIILTTLPNQKVADTHYVSPSEIYVLSYDETTFTYYLSKWNGDSLVPVDTVTVASGTGGMGETAGIAYKNSGEYYAAYRDGTANSHDTILRKYVNGTMDSTIDIPWQFGSMEGGFTSIKYFDGRVFLAGSSKAYAAKVFTVDADTLTFNDTPVYTRAAPSAWSGTALHAVNNSLYFVRGAHSGSVAEAVFAKWDGSGFTELCAATTSIPGGNGVYPMLSVVQDDTTVFLSTNQSQSIYPPNQARLDKVTVSTATAWNTAENVYNLTPADYGIWAVAGDGQGHWRKKNNVAAGTYDYMRFDYGTNTEAASYTGIPYYDGWGAGGMGESSESGDADHLVYAIISSATDTDLRLITLP